MTRTVDRPRVLLASPASGDEALHADLACSTQLATTHAPTPPAAQAAPAQATELPADTRLAASSSRLPATEPLQAQPLSALRKTSGIDLEARLNELLERPLPHGREIVRNDKDDGGVLTYEQLDDGTSVNRTFSAKGELRAEGLYAISGEEIHRTYHENGKLRELTWIRPNEPRILVRFDGEGEELGRWRVYKNGRQERF